MKTLAIAILFLPYFCHAQQRLVSSDDDVWINTKLKIHRRIINQKSIDSVLGRPDSIWVPIVQAAPGYDGPLYVNQVISYPNAEFTIGDDGFYINNITFTKRTQTFFVNFGTQILTVNTTMDDVKKYFHIANIDSSNHTAKILGKTIKVKSIEIENDSGATDQPTWIFDFFEERLVRIVFAPHDA